MMASTPRILPICAAEVGAVAVGQILFGQNFIQHAPLDDAVSAVLHQVLDQQVADAAAHVHVGAKQRLRRRAHRAVLKIQDGHALLARRRLLLGERRLRDAQHHTQNQNLLQGFHACLLSRGPKARFPRDRARPGSSEHGNSREAAGPRQRISAAQRRPRRSANQLKQAARVVVNWRGSWPAMSLLHFD
jgi:hypothetical protein